MLLLLRVLLLASPTQVHCVLCQIGLSHLLLSCWRDVRVKNRFVVVAGRVYIALSWTTFIDQLRQSISKLAFLWPSSHCLQSGEQLVNLVTSRHTGFFKQAETADQLACATTCLLALAVAQFEWPRSFLANWLTWFQLAISNLCISPSLYVCLDHSSKWILQKMIIILRSILVSFVFALDCVLLAHFFLAFLLLLFAFVYPSWAWPDLH